MVKKLLLCEHDKGMELFVKNKYFEEVKKIGNNYYGLEYGKVDNKLYSNKKYHDSYWYDLRHTHAGNYDEMEHEEHLKFLNALIANKFVLYADR